MESNSLDYEEVRKGLEELVKGRNILPQKVQLNPQGACNQNCCFCSYRNAGFEEEGMDYFKLTWFKDGVQKIVEGESGLSERVSREICEDINSLGIGETEITGGGEPMIHPHIYTIFDILNQGKSKISLVTNGTRLRTVVPYITNRWGWIRLSINAGTRDIYRTVHQNDSFDQVISSIAEVREQTEVPMYVSFCVVPENAGEIVEATKLMKRLGTNGIKFNAVYTLSKDGRFSDREAEMVKQSILEAKKEETGDFKVMDSFWKRDRFTEEQKFDHCWFQYFMVNIGYDGRVFPCCITTMRESYAYGDLNLMRLPDILVSEERRSKELGYNYTKCPTCWLSEHNRKMSKVVNGMCNL